MFESSNFSMNKSEVPFSTIGADHALEQENRVAKVIGSIKGIGNHENALSDYFLTAAEMGNTVESFSTNLDEKEARKREEHYQLTGTKNTRLTENVKKILEVFDTHDINFETCGEVFNILTKKVLPENLAQNFLSVKEIGEQKYWDFVNERLLGEKSIWDTMKKSKLPTFICNNVQLKIHVNNQYLTLKKKRKLVSRFVIAARCCPDIDLPGYFGMYEFSVVLKSLFTPDGNLHKCSDKANVADEIYNLQASVMLDNETLDGDSNEENKVIIFDGIAIVNLIDIKKQKIKICLEFASAFFSITIKDYKVLAKSE